MWIINIIVGVLAGLLSGCGIGGGSLLMLWLTIVCGIVQNQAAGINLVFFIFSATPAIIGHRKQNFLDPKVACFTIIGGIPACVLAAILADSFDAVLLHKGFGALLLIIGFKELFHRKLNV